LPPYWYLNISRFFPLIDRRKGENAQQVIDLSVALKTTEKELVEKQKKIDSLEAQLVSLTEDIKFAEAKSRELEETNQLLKVRYRLLG
jgi:chromosome segregation ATPase